MVTTGEDARRVLDAERVSKGTVTVTFNYRYAPIHTKIKEMVWEGKLGRITSVDLNWYLDTYHGSSYFKRWNRRREMSGGLSIHKSTHHFDLVNWWIGQKPVEAFAYGDLHYYGAEGSLIRAKKTVAIAEPASQPAAAPITHAGMQVMCRTIILVCWRVGAEIPLYRLPPGPVYF